MIGVVLAMIVMMLVKKSDDDGRPISGGENDINAYGVRDADSRDRVVCIDDVGSDSDSAEWDSDGDSRVGERVELSIAMMTV